MAKIELYSLLALDGNLEGVRFKSINKPIFYDAEIDSLDLEGVNILKRGIKIESLIPCKDGMLRTQDEIKSKNFRFLNKSDNFRFIAEANKTLEVFEEDDGKTAFEVYAENIIESDNGNKGYHDISDVMDEVANNFLGVLEGSEVYEPNKGEKLQGSVEDFHKSIHEGANSLINRLNGGNGVYNPNSWITLESYREFYKQTHYTNLSDSELGYFNLEVFSEVLRARDYTEFLESKEIDLGKIPYMKRYFEDKDFYSKEHNAINIGKYQDMWMPAMAVNLLLNNKQFRSFKDNNLKVDKGYLNSYGATSIRITDKNELEQIFKGLNIPNLTNLETFKSIPSAELVNLTKSGYFSDEGVRPFIKESNYGIKLVFDLDLSESTYKQLITDIKRANKAIIRFNKTVLGKEV